MVKTPTVEKIRKSTRTPKTVPKKLSTPTVERNFLDVPRRGQLDFDAKTSINVESICTPSRTTRSMAKVTLNDMPPPAFTPSKRKTIASTSSAKKSKKSVVRPDNDEPSYFGNETAEGNRESGKFVRPRQSNEDYNEQVEANNTNAVESNDEDFASVSQLGMSTLDETVRTRKSKLSISSKYRSSPVPTQNKRLSAALDDPAEENRESGKFVRPRQSKEGFNEQIEANNTNAVESNDEDLASVSQLGMSTLDETVRTRKSKLSISSKYRSSPVPTPNKRLSAGKSNQSMTNAIESIVNDLALDKPAEENRESGKFVRPRQSKEGFNEQIEANNTNAVESNDEDFASVSQLGSTLGEVVRTRKSKLSIASIDGSSSTPNKRTSEHSSAAKESKSRMSVIDLTDSPVAKPNTSVLNVTFTEESNNETTFQPVNDKTFSPVPSTSVEKSPKKKQEQATPAKLKTRASLETKAKSTGKKKSSPPLKRLQNTPFSKSKIQNNLNTSNKMSSAKKAKVAEATVNLISSTKVNKEIEKVKATRVTIESPKSKIFKFGTENQQNPVFRFSLVSEHLKNPQIGKPNVKPVPNFTNIHKQMFKKAESIDEARNRQVERAKILLSGKKPPQELKNHPKSATKIPKFQLNVNTDNNAVQRKPLAHVNRQRLNDEERQERRKQLFKQGSKRTTASKNIVPEIKGVRMNRRFELMMKNRNAVKKN
ncbi:E3 ubiquitin-protein ligase RBBP6-like isoform X2 [Contarinia nasturtii]|uniref:E3 ubiquitin-protein ligase RBBP6-like isoform X2 n=1 Tax=Contarinia nasturtii TaxID=265458 RepID=UPI0012D4569A|nr:E3 ubiquitin-protein ligase RBBP6-like isoform X2 [Contarinia nasturtii]